MLIIYNTITKESKLYSDEFIGNIKLEENEVSAIVDNTSEMAQKILNSFDYELVIGENGLEDVKVNKTLEQHRQEEEQSPAFLMRKIKEELTILDIQVPRIIEDILAQTSITLHQSKLDVIARKQELRNQLNNL